MKGNGNWSFGGFGKDKLDLPWPVMENGEPEKPVFLISASGFDLECEMTVSLLRSFEIPVLRRYPGGGGLGKVCLGFSGSGTDLFVPESMLDKAREVLDAPPVDEDE